MCIEVISLSGGLSKLTFLFLSGDAMLEWVDLPKFCRKWVHIVFFTTAAHLPWTRPLSWKEPSFKMHSHCSAYTFISRNRNTELSTLKLSSAINISIRLLTLPWRWRMLISLKHYQTNPQYGVGQVSEINRC